MQINFQCSGGYANLRLTYQANTEELPDDLTSELEDLVRQANFFSFRPNQLAARSAGPPDVFTYQLSIAANGQQNSLIVTDVNAPDSLHPLLDRLRQLAIAQRQSS